MIQSVAKRVAKWLQCAGAISADDTSLYEYGIYCVLFTMIPLVLVLLIGIPLGMTWEAILLVIPFILLRKFCGGFHFKSSTACFFTSITVLLCFLLGIRWVMESRQYTAFWIITSFSVTCICILSPIDSDGRRLSDKEKGVFKKVAIVLSLAIILICGLLHQCGCIREGIAIGSSLSLSAVLQIPCLIIKRVSRRKHTVNS